MTYSAEILKTRRWYISHEILSFEKSVQAAAQGNVRLWENLILIEADSPEEAYRKAIEHGRLSEEPVTIDGADGRCRFLGLRDLVLVYDQLEDGAELEWHEQEISTESLDHMIKPKEKFHAFNLELDETPGNR